MEIAVWTFIFIILLVVYKALKYEKQNSIYKEKEFLRRYKEIKNIDFDHRQDSLKEWEEMVFSAIDESDKHFTGKIIPFAQNKPK